MEPQTARGPTLLCDFCNEPVTYVYNYDAAPLSMKFGEAVVYICDSKWAACPICSQMINENHWDDLTGRSYELWLKAEAGPRQNGLASDDMLGTACLPPSFHTGWRARVQRRIAGPINIHPIAVYLFRG
jgi:hypothetical protein